MTVIAPPLDTGGRAIFSIRTGTTRCGAERTVMATNRGRLDEKRDWKLVGKREGPNMCAICRPPDDAAI